MTEIQWLWEGELDSPLEGYKGLQGGGLPQVRIGKPAWWDDEAFGNAWIPPSGGARYGLVRFAFSLVPQAGQTIREAELSVGLRGLGTREEALFFDLLPDTQTVVESGDLKAALGPALKLPGGFEFSLASVEATEHVRKLVPVLHVSGRGQSEALWRWSAHEQHPLTGDRLAYAVLELPADAAAARAKLALLVKARGPLGFITGVLPQAAQEHLNVILGG